MSDVDDDNTFQNQDLEPLSQAGGPVGTLGDVEHDEDNDTPGKERRPNYGDEEEDDEEEDDDDEEGEELGGPRAKKRAKHRHKRPAAHRFIDFEAVVDEEDEEEEEEEYERDQFIAPGGEADEEEDVNRRAANHARLDRRDREFDDQELSQIAQNLSKRYGRTTVRYTGDMNEVPQRLLMPSVNDPSLWQVRVKPGRERDIVFSLMRKAIDLEYTARPINIFSAFQRDSLPGMIYVEARSSQQVSQACNGLVGVYPSRGINLVPIDEMSALLQIKKQDLNVTPGSWVRFKRGKYQGDLAQVILTSDNREEAELKFIPRIDLNPKDDPASDGRKRKKSTIGSTGTMRPPQRFFNYEEVIKVYGRKQVSRRNQIYVFQTESFKDGFMEKDFKLTALVLENVNPTLDEITRFTRGQDGAEHEGGVDLSIIAEASRKAAISVLQPGDHVEVFEGEQSGLHGVVLEIAQDVVKIAASGVDMEGQKVDIPARSVRKRFKPGDHVKVMNGQNADETGLVVSVADNVVTFLSDMSMQEVSVFSKDLREAAEVGSGTNVVGNYELHDLVSLDMQTVGVIFKTERDSFRVLDQNGQVRLVQPHQISMRRNSDRAIATDSEGHELRINDNMKEVEGEGRKGRVLHIHQSFFAFLHNRDIIENGGVFVTRARSLASLAPKGNLVKNSGADLSKMNPALSAPGGMVGSGTMGRGPRDRLIGITVCVTKGPHKGYVGIIKDTNGPIARVELLTNNKVITVDKEKLKDRLPDGQLVPLGSSIGLGRGSGQMGPPSQFGGRTPSTQGSRTPGWGAVRTPNPYGDGRTPAWNASSRTPNPYADSGRTPAWNASSRTPNPYATDGGRTPAWNANSRTPNPARDTGAGGWGGATPRGPSAAASGGWGSPVRQSSTWGNAEDSTWGGNGTETAWSAPTPTAAPTPGYSAVATPGPISAATPAAYAYPYRTPDGVFATGSGISARTPGAPTPGPSNAYVNPDSSAPYVVPEMWLKDHSHHSHSFVVEVKGSRGDASHPIYEGGEIEGQQGHTGPILDAGLDPTVRFIPFRTGQPERQIPIRYIVPVPPKGKGNLAMPLVGDRKGEVLRVGEVDQQTCTLIAQASGMAVDVPTDQVVRVFQGPADTDLV